MLEQEIKALLTASQSSDWDTRDRAATQMASYLPDASVEHRLVQMLHDPDIAVQVSATESLVTKGGRSALLAVLSDFGERIDDPDTDSMATKLQELQGSQRAPILQQAREVLADGTTPSVEAGINEIERLFGYYL